MKPNGTSSALLSILTPVHCSTPVDLVEKAADSVRRIEMPEGWEAEWVIQEDGEQPVFQELFRSLDVGISLSYDMNSRQFGAATTRTACFIRSRGSLVTGLDADDYLVPDGIAKLVEQSVRHEELDWFTGQTVHLVDGEEVARVCDLRSGVIPSGGPMRQWVESGRMPFPTAPVMLRSRELWKLGGWPALVRSEDASLIFAYTATRAGLITDDVSYVYRKWPDQTRDQPWWTHARDLAYEHRVRWADAMLGADQG